MNGEPVMVRMSAIEYRPELNPRDHLSTAFVADVVRDLKNGKSLPPIHVHRSKAVLFDGAHRFKGFQEFHGEQWRDASIPVIWRDDLPDPDENAVLFRADAARVNGIHGLRMTRFERRRTLAELAKECGESIMLQYAGDMSETAESAKELVASFVRPMPLERVYEERQQLAAASGETITAEPRTSRGVNMRSETIPTGHLRPVRPIIKVACRRLLEALAMSKGDLTDADRGELEAVYQELGRVLGEPGASTH